jgi:hypothetical protein
MVRLLKGKKPAEIIIGTHNENGEPITAVIDSTGLTTTTTTKGAYIEDKWKKEGEEKVCQIAHSG